MNWLRRVLHITPKRGVTLWVTRNWLIDAEPEYIITQRDNGDFEISGYVITTRETWERLTGQHLEDFPPQDGAA